MPLNGLLRADVSLRTYRTQSLTDDKTIYAWVDATCQISRICLFVQLTDDPDEAATAVLSNFIEACVWSITESDFLSVREAIRTFDFNVRIVSIFSFRIRFFLFDILRMACLGQPMCGGRGRGFCSNAWCLCEPGYHCFSVVSCH